MAKKDETTHGDETLSLAGAVMRCRQQQDAQNARSYSASPGCAKYPGKVIRFSEWLNQENVTRASGGMYKFRGTFFVTHKQGAKTRVASKYAFRILHGFCLRTRSRPLKSRGNEPRSPEERKKPRQYSMYVSFSEFCRLHWQIRRRYVAFKRDVPSIGVSKFLERFTLPQAFHSV